MDDSPPGPAAEAYTVRPFHPDDAAGVARLVESVYGATYYPPDLYHPGRIVRLNEDGQLVSVVALDPAGGVVGHYAVERPRPGAVAEASDAIVAPPCRHHQLLERMRVVLRGEAVGLGLAGLVGYPVTNHVFSQKAEEHFGAKPCGVALGLWPRTFHNLPEPLPQRMSFVLYFEYLRRPAGVVHEDTPHAEVVARIAGQYGVPVEVRPAGSPAGVGEVEVEYEGPVQAGTVRVRRVGADTAAAVRRAGRELVGRGARAVTLELPLAQPGAAAVCRAAEADGFFFCGLGPAFADDGDVLLLQLVVEDLDLSLVQLDGPFARDLLAYVGRERDRVRAAGPGAGG
ncbi:MAG: hypothetical protein K2X87_22920 [Gemmataceae bacterium]|nr:hypothetical protein [Gemmataceae bacterium]